MAVWSRPNYNGCVNKKFEDLLLKVKQNQDVCCGMIIKAINFKTN